jgi:pimeloyl-ACP methyl ester carboxylesterase
LYPTPSILPPNADRLTHRHPSAPQGFVQQALFARKPSQDVVALLDAVAADVRPNSVRIALEAIAAADLRHVLPQIEVPTLLVWGELDALPAERGA